jgi:ABC-type oligopeptide transport system substrate-binding subunit
LVLHSASPIHAPLGYSSPEIDRLVTACQTTLEPEMRRELLYSVARRVAEQRALLPLVWGMDLYGVRRDVVWRPTNSGTIDLQNITRRPR